MKSIDVITIAAVVVVLVVGAYFFTDGFSGLLSGGKTARGGEVYVKVNTPFYDPDTLEFTLSLTFENRENRIVRIPDLDVRLENPNGADFPYNPDSSTKPFNELAPNESRDMFIVYYVPNDTKSAILWLTTARGTTQFKVFSNGQPVLEEGNRPLVKL